MAPLSELGRTDIYLIDQIMKGRFRLRDKILDAGCGRGRNMQWFLANGYQMTGVDSDPAAIKATREMVASVGRDDTELHCCPVENMPFADATFDHVISSAVLHFAEDHAHFKAMVAEMVRALKPGGSLWIRMTTDVGIGHLVQPDDRGIALLPDGTERYLLTRPMLQWMLVNHNLEQLEPFKNVNVDDQRVMCVLVVGKVIP